MTTLSPPLPAVKPEGRWEAVLARARAAAPEAFDADGRPLNLVRGEWGTRGHPRPVISPVDGTLLTWLPMLDLPEARDAVRAGADEARAWGRVDLDERRRRVAACLDELQEHRELVASIATDDPVVAATVSERLRAFKVGVNRVRSRGDREEAFGGLGESWRGAFVGGEHLVRAVTTGEGDDRLYGTFPHGTLLPERR